MIKKFNTKTQKDYDAETQSKFSSSYMIIYAYAILRLCVELIILSLSLNCVSLQILTLF
jgi:hypothetical protein